jgi:predicted exporter
MPKLSGKILNILLLLGVLLGGYLALGVKVEENAMDLLPGEALRGDLELLQQLGVVNQVYLSLECDQALGGGPTAPPELLRSAGAVGAALAESPLFCEVFYRLPEGYEFGLATTLRRYLPVLLDPYDLKEIEGRLAPAALDQRMRQAFLTLNNPTGLLMARLVQNDPLDLTGLMLGKLASLRGRLRLTVQDGYFVSEDGRHCLVWAESVTPLIASAPATAVKAELDRVLAKSLEKGVRARLIGPLPHTLSNSETIKRDLARLLPFDVVVLLLVLFLALRTWQSLVVVLIPFLAAPPALALLSLFYPRISAMSLGFGIVLLGSGADYAIHLYLGARMENGRAVVPGGLRRSLLVASLTTFAVFIALLFSHVPSHRQMATLAIFGMAFSILLAVRLVPPLGAYQKSEPAALAAVRRLLVVPGRGWGGLLLAGWLLLLIGGVVGWSRLHYNGDLKSMDTPTAEVVADEREFLATWAKGGEQAFVVAAGATPETALDLNDRVYARLTEAGKLTGVQSLAPVLPGPTRQARNGAAWQSFWTAQLPTLQPALERAATAQGFAPGAFAPFLAGVTQPAPPLSVTVLTDGPLHPFLAALFRQVPAVAGGSERHYLATTLVPDGPETASVLDALGREIPGVRVLSNTRWRQQVDVLMRSDILTIIAGAGLVVLLICFLAFRNARDLLATLAPVLSAQAAMAVFAWLTGGELNMMHLLMGILVIGMSVDYGIFIVTACREGLSAQTFLAISLCALSTLSGFGVLAFAVHPALRALGLTVLIGIGAAWPTALWISPVLAGVKKVKPC